MPRRTSRSLCAQRTLVRLLPSPSWNEVLAPIQAAGYPLIIDEFGETDCDHDYVDKLMDWADAQSPQMGYWGWDWSTYDCASEPALLKDSFGTPTQYGVGLRNRLLSIQ